MTVINVVCVLSGDPDLNDQYEAYFDNSIISGTGSTELEAIQDLYRERDYWLELEARTESDE